MITTLWIFLRQNQPQANYHLQNKYVEVLSHNKKEEQFSCGVLRLIEHKYIFNFIIREISKGFCQIETTIWITMSITILKSEVLKASPLFRKLGATLHLNEIYAHWLHRCDFILYDLFAQYILHPNTFKSIWRGAESGLQ